MGSKGSWRQRVERKEWPLADHRLIDTGIEAIEECVMAFVRKRELLLIDVGVDKYEEPVAKIAPRSLGDGCVGIRAIGQSYKHDRQTIIPGRWNEVRKRRDFGGIVERSLIAPTLI